MINVEQWAQIRQMHYGQHLSIRAIARKTGLHRETVKRAIQNAKPPKYSRVSAGISKLDPHKEQIKHLLADDSDLPGKRILEIITHDGYTGSSTVLYDYLRELRPVFSPSRTFQRTVYTPGEICQFDIWKPCKEIPVGRGQTRKGYVITAILGYSRFASATLVFSRSGDDILWALSQCLNKLGGLPQRLVTDREGALHAGNGRPSDRLLAFCGQLPVGVQLLAARDCQAKGVVERHQGYMETNFEPGRYFLDPADFQRQLDLWHEQRANCRSHQTLREKPCDRMLIEREHLQPLPAQMPDCDERRVLRVTPDPYVRIDTNDYSLDPRLVSQRVEVRITQHQVTAVCLDSGRLAALHRRSFARHQTITQPEHQVALDELRGIRAKPSSDVQVRPLARYDQLIAA